MLFEPLGEHGSVLDRMPHQEGLPVAGREGGDRLGDALLGARHLGGVARDEMVDDLLLGQLRHGRQNTIPVAREQNHVVRVVGYCWQLGVGDKLQRICAARVLSDRDVIIVDIPIVFVHHHILDHGPEANRAVDVRLLFLRERDALGIAALPAQQPRVDACVVGGDWAE